MAPNGHSHLDQLQRNYSITNHHHIQSFNDQLQADYHQNALHNHSSWLFKVHHTKLLLLVQQHQKVKRKSLVTNTRSANKHLLQFLFSYYYYIVSC